MEVKDILESITFSFGFQLIDENETNAKFRLSPDYTATLDKKSLLKIIENINELQSNKNIELYNLKYYEVLVREDSGITMNRGSLDQMDTVNKITYSLSNPSEEYLIFLLLNLKNKKVPNLFRQRMIEYRLNAKYGNDDEGKKSFDGLSFFEVVKRIGGSRLRTIRIESSVNRKLDEYENLLHAFIFTLGFNKDINIQPLRLIEEFTQSHRIGRNRRTMLGDLEPPRRIYINDLVLHYQKAISSDSIDHQYLSYYHVMEYFFESIYNDDVISTIQQELTKPDFSYKRQRDIKGLIRTIQKKLRYQNEQFSINELEALELTLKRYIKDLNQLTDSLNQITESLSSYYRDNEVKFCQGNKVNLENINSEEVYRNLAKRIYKTRNAIVHSKDNEKSKYIPFKNDKDLINELYLMRLISETLILETSKEL